MANKSYVKIALIFVVLATLLFCFAVYKDKTYMSKTTITNFDNIQNLNYDLYKKEISNGILKIEGWAYEPGEAVQTFDVSVALKEKDSDMAYILPTQNLYTTKMETSHSEIDYGNSGFMSKAKINALNTGISEYEIILIYKNNQKNYIIDTKDSINIQN